MTYEEEVLYSIVKEHNENPNKIWTYLLNGDKLVMNYEGRKYITEVSLVSATGSTFKTKYLYSLTSDKFWNGGSEAKTSDIIRYPQPYELDKLTNNIGYIQWSYQ